MQLRHLITACVLLTSSLLSATASYADIVAGQYELVNSTRVSRTDFVYDFQLNVTNTGAAATNISANVASSSQYATVIDGVLSFNDLAAGASTMSTDTFSVRINRTVAFDPSMLTFTFSFVEIPQSPDDKDKDGYTPAEGDCDDSNPAVHPGAESIPNNGIDENCDGQDPIVGPDFSVRITSPASLVTLGATPVNVRGVLDDSAAVLTVNGVVVTPDDSGAFSVNVDLDEGHNAIVARAVKGGQQVTDTVSVSLDLTPPYVTIESHTDEQSVFNSSITVTGLINDIVRGTVEESQATVTVNGIDATISNRSYSVRDVALVEGANQIKVLGTDQVGNIGEKIITVNYVVPQGRRLELVSGQNQSAPINTVLPESLSVKVLDDALQPVANTPVVFRVIQGSGSVGVGTDKEGRAVVLETGAEGTVSTNFKLGSRSGTDNHKVRARVVGYDTEIIFNASATGKTGNKISVNSGNNQRGAVGQILPEAFVVNVTDGGANVVKDARVRFTVTKGGGELAGVGSSEFSNLYEATTDSDGRATAEYRLGYLEGIDAQRITATLLDAPTDSEGNVQLITAGFTATAFVPGDSGQTSISGVVLDNQDTPIPGVTVRVEGTERQDVTDDQGQFKIEQAPNGPVHLIADGSTAIIDGEFPALSYNIVTVAGVDNPLSAPIYMVKLDTDGAVYAGPEDVELTLGSFPGFKLEIAKDSVTFPDGAKEGFISVTPVNSSKVPMAPPNGMQPQFIVTIQPAGTKFDPPARLFLPNVDGHAPGAQVEMYSYDHDLEEFVSIGLGTVSEDSTVITSNPGVGVIKAGWHCGSQPGGQGCAHNCPICQDCDGDCNCVAKSGDPRLGSLNTEGDCKKPECQNGSPVQVADDGDLPEDVEGDCKKPGCSVGSPTLENDDTDEPTDECKYCEDGAIKNKQVIDVIAMHDGNAADAIIHLSTAFKYSVSVGDHDCDSLKYEWDFGDGGSSSSASGSYTYSSHGEYTAKVTVSCSECDTVLGEDTIKIVAFSASIEKPTGDPVAAGSADNEVTYMGAAGIATIPVVAKVEPASAAGDAEDMIRWKLNRTPMGSVLTWSTSWAGDAAAGKGVNASGTLTGYPAQNNQFGSNSVEMEVVDDGSVVYSESADFELFFERDVIAAGRAAPNWFVYWSQVSGGANLNYAGASGSSLMAQVRGMLAWSYTVVPDKTGLHIYGEVVTKTRAYGVGEEMSGIDNFVGTVIHEGRHVTQISLADALLPSSGSDSFRYGWSWNQATHNHWTKGGDGQWGVAGTDDDGNGTTDDAKAVPPFEPGNGDDVSLDHAAIPQWPNSWVLPVPDNAPHPIESEAVNAQDNAMNEHDNSGVDWADPGKQHRTLNDYAD